ncbi:unnamed protein product, partial [Protopolystoma xenopodis]
MRHLNMDSNSSQSRPGDSGLDSSEHKNSPSSGATILVASESAKSDNPIETPDLSSSLTTSNAGPEQSCQLSPNVTTPISSNAAATSNDDISASSIIASTS